MFFYLAQIEIFRELNTREDELFDLGEDPDDHGREGKLFREGRLFQTGVRVWETIDDTLVLDWGCHLVNSKEHLLH